MKVQYKTKSGRLVFEIQGESQKSLFKGISEVQEVFESDSYCGHCNSDDICFQVRSIDGNDFYELLCRSCHAELSFGQHKGTDTLWPKRYDENKKPLPDNGWKIWRNGG